MNCHIRFQAEESFVPFPFSDTDDSEADVETDRIPPRSQLPMSVTPSVPVQIARAPNGVWDAPHETVASVMHQQQHQNLTQDNQGSGDEGADSDDGIPIVKHISFEPSSVGSTSAWGSLESEKVLKSGYLKKKGEKRKTWKTRWFVLRTTKLAYYKNEKEYEILNIIPLENVTTVADVDLANRSNVFGVVTRDRTYYLQASGPTEAESWIFLLREAQREVQKVVGEPRPILSRVIATAAAEQPTRKVLEFNSPPLANAAAIIGSTPRPEGRVQFADSIAIVSGSSSKRPSASGGSFKPVPAVGYDLPSALKRPSVAGNSSGKGAEAIEDSASQISGRDSIVTADSSLLTYVSTPSMLPAGSSIGQFPSIGDVAVGRSAAPEFLQLSSTPAGDSSVSLNLALDALVPANGQMKAASTDSSVPIYSQRSDMDLSITSPSNTTNPSSPMDTSQVIQKQPGTYSVSNGSSQNPDFKKPRGYTAPSAGAGGLSSAASEAEGGFTDANISTGANQPPLKSALRKPRGQSAPNPVNSREVEEPFLRNIGDDADGIISDTADVLLNSPKQDKKKPFILSSSDEDEEDGAFGGHSANGGVSAGVLPEDVIVGVTDSTVVREGYLLKQGTKYNKAWKKRWFVLRNGNLMCYKDSAEYVVKRIIPLRSALDILEIDPQGRNHAHCFTVILPKRTLILAATSSEEMVQWIDDLRRIHKVLRGEM
ncbi:hypothetical protein HDU84_004656 [Entophlyctis sp. JEL0112]|nr:hypothetical protein HDU84_004656 [Entophlyctis sp. JEL0112]